MTSFRFCHVGILIRHVQVVAAQSRTRSTMLAIPMDPRGDGLHRHHVICSGGSTGQLRQPATPNMGRSRLCVASARSPCTSAPAASTMPTVEAGAVQPGDVVRGGQRWPGPHGPESDGPSNEPWAPLRRPQWTESGERWARANWTAPAALSAPGAITAHAPAWGVAHRRALAVCRRRPWRWTTGSRPPSRECPRGVVCALPGPLAHAPGPVLDLLASAGRHGRAWPAARPWSSLLRSPYGGPAGRPRGRTAASHASSLLKGWRSAEHDPRGPPTCGSRRTGRPRGTPLPDQGLPRLGHEPPPGPGRWSSASCRTNALIHTDRHRRPAGWRPGPAPHRRARPRPSPSPGSVRQLQQPPRACSWWTPSPTAQAPCRPATAASWSGRSWAADPRGVGAADMPSSGEVRGTRDPAWAPHPGFLPPSARGSYGGAHDRGGQRRRR